MSKAPPFKFAVSIETEDATGDALSVYFYIRKGKQHHVKEFAKGAAIADYDKNGYLLGVELLAPCRVKIVDEVAKTESVTNRAGIKRFIKQNGPRMLVPA